MAAPITKRKKNQVLKLLQEMPKKKRQIAKLLKLSHEKVYQIARENGIIIQYTSKREKQATISIYKGDKAFLQMESDRLNILMYKFVTIILDQLENHKEFVVGYKRLIKRENSINDYTSAQLNYQDKDRIKSLSKCLKVYNYDLISLAIRLYKTFHIDKKA